MGCSMRSAERRPRSRALFRRGCASSPLRDRLARCTSARRRGSTSIRRPTGSRPKPCSCKGCAVVEKSLRLAYSCHDAFPSSDTNTQQIFWTVIEVARLGARVDLVMPSVSAEAGVDPRVAIGAHYGASIDSMPRELCFLPAGDRPASSWMAKGSFDWTVPRRVGNGHYDLIWTRDLVAAAACARAGLPVVFETYRPDIAARRRFAWWRSVCFSSRHVRGFVLHSQVAADAFIRAGASPDRCLVAHNGFAPAL